MDSDGPIRGRSVDRNRRRERVGRGPRKYAPAARQNKLHVLNPRELRRNCHLSAPAKISRVFWSGGGGWFWSAGSQGWLLVTKLMCNQSTLKFSERVRRVSQIRSGGERPQRSSRYRATTVGQWMGEQSYWTGFRNGTLGIRIKFTKSRTLFIFMLIHPDGRPN